MPERHARTVPRAGQYVRQAPLVVSAPACPGLRVGRQRKDLSDDTSWRRRRQFPGPPVPVAAHRGRDRLGRGQDHRAPDQRPRYVNPDAAPDWAALKAGGQLRIGYFFGHPGTSATDTVALFTSEIQKLGLADNDGVALDLEVTDGRTPA